MDQTWIDNFRIKLDQHHSWPELYMFKFIVPKGKVEEFKHLFVNHTLTEKTSAQGNYVSITLQIMAVSSDAVMDVYKQAASIEGLISL